MKLETMSDGEKSEREEEERRKRERKKRDVRKICVVDGCFVMRKRFFRSAIDTSTILFFVFFFSDMQLVNSILNVKVSSLSLKTDLITNK